MKKELIKLGHAHPELQKHIVAVLDATEGLKKSANFDYSRSLLDQSYDILAKARVDFMSQIREDLTRRLSQLRRDGLTVEAVDFRDDHSDKEMEIMVYLHIKPELIHDALVDPDEFFIPKLKDVLGRGWNYKRTDTNIRLKYVSPKLIQMPK